MHIDEPTAKVPRIAVVFVILCGISVVGWLSLMLIERGRIVPPRGVMSLTDFAVQMPAAKKFARIDLGGAPRFVWVGEQVAWAFRSGPPCYVFDSSGKLAEWDWETGSGQNTSALAQMALKAEPITVEQALAYILGPVSNE